MEFPDHAVGANPNLRLRDIAATVGITERTAVQIVSDLEQAGYLTKTRNGRRNTYAIHDELPLRHPRHRHHTVGDLIRFVQDPAEFAADTDSQLEADLADPRRTVQGCWPVGARR